MYGAMHMQLALSGSEVGSLPGGDSASVEKTSLSLDRFISGRFGGEERQLPMQDAAGLGSLGLGLGASDKVRCVCILIIVYLLMIADALTGLNSLKCLQYLCFTVLCTTPQLVHLQTATALYTSLEKPFSGSALSSQSQCQQNMYMQSTRPVASKSVASSSGSSSPLPFPSMVTGPAIGSGRESLPGPSHAVGKPSGNASSATSLGKAGLTCHMYMQG